MCTVIPKLVESVQETANHARGRAILDLQQWVKGVEYIPAISSKHMKNEAIMDEQYFYDVLPGLN
jgi:hypothetical protein